MSSLTGQGGLQLKDVRLARFGPEALEAAVARAIPPLADDQEPTEVKLDSAFFRAIVAAELDKSTLLLGSRTVALELADGALRTKTIAIDVPRGRLKGASYLDVSSGRIDSEWTIETLGRFEARASKAADAPRAGSSAATGASTTLSAANVPGVSLILAGPLGELARLEPRLNTDALARELLARRIERDLEAIERARKKKENAEALRVKQREDAERLVNEQRRRDEQAALEKAKALDSAGEAKPQPAKATLEPGLSLPGSIPVPAGTEANRAPADVPVPTPVPVGPQGAAGLGVPASDAGKPATTSSISPPDAASAGAASAENASAGNAPPATKPAAAPRAKSEGANGSAPPPKANRQPGIFDQTRGL